MGNCAKWEKQTLWTAVDNPCGKPGELARARLNVLLKDKSFNDFGLLVEALLDGIELVDAKVDALELQLAQLLGILDEPLSPTDSLIRLRQLREQML